MSFSNAPGLPELIYGNAFFPFPAAVQVGPGDRVTGHVSAHPVGDGYVWQWNTRIHDTSFEAVQLFRQPYNPADHPAIPVTPGTPLNVSSPF